MRSKVMCQFVDYSKVTTPLFYKCASCGTTGVKLWRLYVTLQIELLCAECAVRLSEICEKSILIMPDGSHMTKLGISFEIGGRVPAVPVEGERAYWGVCTISKKGFEWWKGLPIKAL